MHIPSSNMMAIFFSSVMFLDQSCVFPNDVVLFFFLSRLTVQHSCDSVLWPQVANGGWAERKKCGSQSKVIFSRQANASGALEAELLAINFK